MFRRKTKSKDTRTYMTQETYQESINENYRGNYYVSDETKYYQRLVPDEAVEDELAQIENQVASDSPLESRSKTRISSHSHPHRLQYHQGINRFLNRAIIIVGVMLIMVLLVAFLV